MKILKTNQQLKLVDNSVEIHEKLPLGIYTLGYNDITREFYLSEQNFTEFKLPSKLYGNADEIVKRVIDTHTRKNNKMGILLYGEKGTGKSIISKKIINSLGLPVIMIKDYFNDSSTMESFLNELRVPVVVFIDEFEKIYRNSEMQSKLLSIMDGTGQSDILFVLTSNTNDNISDYLKNRPGRVYYSIKFDSLDRAIVDSVIKDRIFNPERIKIVQKACTIIGDVNFDLLVSIIDEINHNDTEDVNELLYYLNIEPSNSNYDGYAFFKRNPDYVTVERYLSNPLSRGNVSVEGSVYSVKTNRPISEETAMKEEIPSWNDAKAIIEHCENLTIDDDTIEFENDEYKFLFKRVKLKRLVF